VHTRTKEGSHLFLAASQWCTVRLDTDSRYCIQWRNRWQVLWRETAVVNLRRRGD